MKRINTEILVIGGGATGTGVLRDVAMRGLKTILIEKGDLTHGTTGRYHGLLHSGGRYAVKDPQAAKECIAENKILRHIMPQCIEDTGGFFISTPWDDPEYADHFMNGCSKTGIPIEEISISQMLREEPVLNPQIQRCFRVPDASADSFLAADLNRDSARQYGAQSLNYHKVTNLKKTGNRVTGAICLDLYKDEIVDIEAALVVNASGAWAGQIASMAGINVNIVPGKGIMIAVNHRIVNTVINRCKMPSDGDILVPAHTVAVIGTTDVQVDNPDHFFIDPWEVDLMLEEGEKMIPGFKEMRMLRAWAGVRPLYQETSVNDTRDVTRAFVLLDHEQRDGIQGLITITSGKWTTYRKMAEFTVDLACKKLGVSKLCTTHREPLPGLSKGGHHYAGARLAEIEKHRSFGDLICECELATIEDVKHAILDNLAKTIDDIRRDTRLGMGPCQGGFCTYRAAGLLHTLQNPDVLETNLALRDFLQERWKGLMPILWGQQLRQERLDELIYLDLLNVDHLPGPKAGKLISQDYQSASSTDSYQKGKIENHVEENISKEIAPRRKAATIQQVPEKISPQALDALIIGAGLAGLTAAWQSSVRGRRTRLISKGWGSLFWNSGCVDVLGYFPTRDFEVRSPSEGLKELITQQPEHPYAIAGFDAIQEALVAFQTLCGDAGYPLIGSLERNWLLITALGNSRPTCLAPEMMTAGDVSIHEPTLIVGFDRFPDFYPALTASNLAQLGITTEGCSLDLPELRELNFVTSRILAELFDQDNFCESVANAIHQTLDHFPTLHPTRIGLPAVLGFNHYTQNRQILENQVGCKIFEIPTLPPSIPGIRLHRILVRAIKNAGGSVFDGMLAATAKISPEGIIQTVFAEAASRSRAQPAVNYLLATGGILGGGLKAHYTGWLEEVVFGLPCNAPQNRMLWLNREFLGTEPHNIFRSGLKTNYEFQPIDSQGTTILRNLRIAGSALSGGDFLREHSLEGVALITGYLTGRML